MTFELFRPLEISYSKTKSVNEEKHSLGRCYSGFVWLLEQAFANHA